MKRTLTIAMVTVLAAATAQAVVWSEDFADGTVYYKDVPQGGSQWADGDIYLGDLSGANGGGTPYGIWGVAPGGAWVTDSSNTSDPNILSMDGHNNDSYRGAGVALSTAEIGTGADGTLTFDILDVGGHAGTSLSISIWEAKAGADVYYFDSMAAAVAGGMVADSWGTDVYLQELATASFVNGDEGAASVNFIRQDTSSDLIVMFANQRTADWWNASKVDNVSVEVIPEPATMGLFGLVGGAMLLIRRRMV